MFVAEGSIKQLPPSGIGRELSWGYTHSPVFSQQQIRAPKRLYIGLQTSISSDPIALYLEPTEIYDLATKLLDWAKDMQAEALREACS